MCVVSLFCVSVLRGGGGRLGATNPGPSRRGRRHDRSRLRRIHRAGADRRRAVNATAPSPPARVRVARARVLLSRPVCSSQLLGRGSPCLRTLGLTILSHPSRKTQSLLKSHRPGVLVLPKFAPQTPRPGFFGLCRPHPEPLASTSRASPGSPARFRSAPLAPPARGLATRLSGPKDARPTRARAALGHETSSDHGRRRPGPLQ